MKKINILFVVLMLSILQYSCEKDDVFTGAPDPSILDFVTLTGAITTPENAVVSGQSFPITIDIAPQTFDVDVNIEVTSFLPNINKRTRKTFTIKAGDTTVDGKMNAPSGDQASTVLPFNQNMEVYMSAINSTPVADENGQAPLGFAGKQYTIQSNKLNLDYGDSAFGGINSNRCSIRFDWKNPPGGGNPAANNLNLVLKKNGSVVVVSPNSQTTQPVHGTTVSTSRYEAINFLSTADEGTYVFEIFAQKLISTPNPSDVPFRFTVRFPDERVQTFSSVINGISVGAAATSVPKFQVVKSTDGNGNPEYIASLL
jgi:hypothetical protein